MTWTSRFEFVSRAIIIYKDKILIMRAKGKDFYFLPGGHVNFRESAKQALKRELAEEFGSTIVGATYMGTIENVFMEDSVWRHELNVVFSVTLPQIPTHTLESHIECLSVPLDEFRDLDVRPFTLRDAIMKWTRDKQLFWMSQMPKQK